VNASTEFDPRQIDRAMRADQPRLRGMWRAIRQRQRRNQPTDRLFARLTDQLQRSIDRRDGRQRGRPTVHWPDDLPIIDKRDEIAQAIRDHQVVVVCGQTGSGKSTQLPKICLDIGRGIEGMIGHTQPRRIAARSLATRIADELHTPLGRAVGYKVRFGDHTRDDTYIKLMTDGILLAETQGDQRLEAYDTIIIDEAHERSLNIDFLLGYLRQLLPRRRDLKLIITSATIDPQRFSEYFGGAPVIEVSGRTYPVDVRYRPLTRDDPDEEDRHLQQGILEAVDELAAESTPGSGDILVFLNGEREIRETAESLRKHHPPETQVLPLYARLSSAEQMKVFQPHGGRRIVLATNVAETSLTVPGIRYVIDAGQARVSRFSARARVQRLPIEPISQASAQQRAGRCGRVAPGICIRLYDESDYDNRPQFTPPEILRTNLAAVILQMKALGLGDIESFGFIDPPRRSMVSEGYRTLHELHAVDEYGKLTDIGRQLAALPVDPRVGRMVLAGDREHCLKEVLVLAAALSVQDPRERPADRAEQADVAHARFRDEQSDFFSLLNLWQFYHEQLRKLSRNQLRRACRQNHLSYTRMREWHDVHQQLRELVTERGMRPNRKPADRDRVHRALLTGLLCNIGWRGAEYEYTGANGNKFHLFPGSALFAKRPSWVMAAEIVETSRLYARTVAPIQPKWLEELGAHLVRRHHTNPRWQAESAHVVADERMTLFGLTIIPRQTVHYGPIDPVTSRQLFIHHALVLGEYETRADFAAHNRKLQEKIEALEHKARRHDLLADEQQRYAFYDARIPANVYDGPTFERWLTKASRDQPRLLHMSESDLRLEADPVHPEDFPDEVSIGQTVLPLDYRAEPGHDEDGVTLTVPIELLNQVSDAQLTWLVPGMLEAKATELIRALPRTYRRHFVPAPDFARQSVAELHPTDRPLTEVLGERLAAMTGINVPPDAWPRDELPAHLLMRLRVVDEAGRTLATGRDVSALREQLADHLGERFASLDHVELPTEPMTDWQCGDLPEQVDLKRRQMTIHAWPALVDHGDHVIVQMMDSPQAAEAAMRSGLRRLFGLQVAAEVNACIRQLSFVDRLRVLWAPLGNVDVLHRHLAALTVDRAFLADNPVIRDPATFHARLDKGWHQIRQAADQAGRLLLAILDARQRVAMQMPQRIPAAWCDAVADINAQLDALFDNNFPLEIDWAWLVQYPRYLTAIERRIEKLRDGRIRQDRSAMEQIAPFDKRWRQRRAEHARRNVVDPQLTKYRWMVEEYRVSLFAQELGTSVSVSPRRLERQWAAVQS
jgi:ATP-dependent helicase HrpA